LHLGEHLWGEREESGDSGRLSPNAPAAHEGDRCAGVRLSEPAAQSRMNSRMMMMMRSSVPMPMYMTR
jgi:hypothetical protein